MEIQITKRTTLPFIPSASGIEYIAPYIYIIGDDSPWLYVLNQKLELINKAAIYSLDELEGEIIPKSVKPDFEAMTVVKTQSCQELYLFGSGSKSPMRDVLIKTNLEKPGDYSNYNLAKFYALLKKECALTDDELNIEGVITDNKNLYLLNRGKNIIVWFKIEDFNFYLAEKSNQLKLNFHTYELPIIKNVQSGFSGATFVQKHNLILFTASIENTANWIDDGEVYGSYLGAIQLTELEKSTKPMCLPITEHGKVPAIKIESVAVKAIRKKSISLFLVTDSDGGISELIEANLSF